MLVLVEVVLVGVILDLVGVILDLVGVIDRDLILVAVEPDLFTVLFVLTVGLL